MANHFSGHPAHKLHNGSRVAILGGGPAGAFFAIRLFREAQKVQKKIRVTIIDHKSSCSSPEQNCELKGCNYCAGIVSPRLHKALARNNIVVPQELVCQQFSHIWFHGLWKNFPLKIPSDQKMYSLFRGSLPSDRPGNTQGFDSFLLDQARSRGAEIITGRAFDICFTQNNKPCLILSSDREKKTCIESDFLAIATGINHLHKDREQDVFFKSYEKINPDYRPPKVRPAFIFELKPGRTYLKRHIHKEIYFIVSGSEELQLDHISLVPKGKYLTIALIGRSIDDASFPSDTKAIMEKFLKLKQVRAILPNINLNNTPVACTCTPLMVAGPSEHPNCNRIATVGDALGSRLYRDGIFSAYVSAEALARTVIHKGVDKKHLDAGCEKVLHWLKTDTRYARLVIQAIQTILKSPVLSRIFYQTFATEMKFQKKEQWSLGKVLFDLGSGTVNYAKIFNNFIQPSVFLSIFKGFIKTVRNILTELFFGLSWKDCGRYPTVVLKEKRDYFKQAIQAPLNFNLADNPEMERMYAIKVRAHAKIIYEELGKFGEQDSKFLNLRFLDVKRVFGPPNQEGSIVQYRLKNTPVAMDICLEQSIPGKTLFYKPSELFASNGILLFDIAPTKDGNNRLVVYTAFDFKKGSNPVTWLLWKLFKLVFPDFAHDVVWNHAVCIIKKQAENRASQPKNNISLPDPDIT